MTKIDPIIAVKNVQESALWYCHLFDWINAHGGNNFAVLVDKSKNVMLCLHEWGTHEHPTMEDQTIQAGNGLILYFRTDDMGQFMANIKKINYLVEQEIHQNPNSTKKEFSLRDLDGYYLIVSEMHDYKG
ncbi:hypothetical protein ABIB40_001416 [Pedobacter sp. UYP30]|uniref:glyoxalase n=1 Tax=Pedobacter sp. UYP30 TaxID=1756400 RepID=UPI003397C68B